MSRATAVCCAGVTSGQRVGQHGDGRHSRRQCRAVRRDVDPESQSADDAESRHLRRESLPRAGCTWSVRRASHCACRPSTDSVPKGLPYHLLCIGHGDSRGFPAGAAGIPDRSRRWPRFRCGGNAPAPFPRRRILCRRTISRRRSLRAGPLRPPVRPAAAAKMSRALAEHSEQMHGALHPDTRSHLKGDILDCHSREWKSFLTMS